MWKMCFSNNLRALESSAAFLLLSARKHQAITAADHNLPWISRSTKSSTTLKQHHVSPYSSTMYCTTLQQHHVLYHLTAAPCTVSPYSSTMYCTTLEQHHVLYHLTAAPCTVPPYTHTDIYVFSPALSWQWWVWRQPKLRRCVTCEHVGSGGITSNLYFRGSRFEFRPRQRISLQIIRDFSQFPKTNSGEVPQQDTATSKSLPILHSQPPCCSTLYRLRQQQHLRINHTF